MRAGTIFNAGSGEITIRAHDSLDSCPSFALEAADGIVNLGTICSDGSLSLHAGEIANRGLIKSQRGNLTFTGDGKGRLQINNTGGKMVALEGWINVSSASEDQTIDLELCGGDWSSQSLNLSSPRGGIQADVG